MRATKLALKLADYTVTEAGFGADLGAEKFLDIKCRKANLVPNAVVIVATVRALKYNGGVSKDNLKHENLEALKKGAANLEAHIDSIHKFGLPIVVALNRFDTDTDAEIEYIRALCAEKDVETAVSEVFAKGGDGGIELAKAVVKACEKPSCFGFIYEDGMSVVEKINAVAKEIYGADGVVIDSKAQRQLDEILKLSDRYSSFPVCFAKTQYSLSDDPKKLGRPSGFTITVREIKLSAGAEFIVVYTGTIVTMPGLPKTPAAYGIDIDKDLKIRGLF